MCTIGIVKYYLWKLRLFHVIDIFGKIFFSTKMSNTIVDKMS